MKYYLKLNYFFLFFVISWEPLQAYILKIDGAGRSVILISLVTFLYNIHRKSFSKIITSLPYAYWGIWVLFAFIITIQDYNFDIPYYAFFARLWVPLLVAWIICHEYSINSNKVLKVIFYSLFLCLMIILLIESTGGTARLGGELNANRIGIYAFSFLVVALYRYYRIRADLFHKLILAVLSLLAIIIIFKTGSRSAFAALAILITGQVIINRSRNHLKTIAFFLFGFIILYFAFSFILTNSDIGKRILETTKQAERTGLETGTIFDLFGDRGFFYVYGFEIFTQHPVTGIGLRNFIKYHSGDVEMEPEIMVHLTELGAIGFLLYILFMGWIGIQLFKVRKYDLHKTKKTTELLIITFLCLIFLATTNTYYQVPAIFAIFGIMIGQIDNLKLQVYNNSLDEQENSNLDN
jgi:hypothetical protein